MELRMLTPIGIQEFRDYLNRVRAGVPERTPRELLQDDKSTALRDGLPTVDVDDVSFSSKREAAQYLVSTLSLLPAEFVRHEIGLWAWLTLFYFDQLAPISPNGVRKLLAEDLYIPSSHHQRRYRHLLLGPYLAYRLHKENARLLLTKPLHVWSDLEEQLMGLQEIMQMPGGWELADLLYFNPETGQPKRGVTNRKKPGTVRRLRDVLLQLDVTFDVYGMKGPELLSLLPPEFERFAPKSAR